MTAATPIPTGRCWCGCGKKIGPGKYFAPNHDRWAEAYVIRSRYGSIAAFLEHHGYGPEGRSARDEAEEAANAKALPEEEIDRLDAEEAHRRLNDPDEVPIPYEEARHKLGLG